VIVCSRMHWIGRTLSLWSLCSLVVPRNLWLRLRRARSSVVPKKLAFAAYSRPPQTDRSTIKTLSLRRPADAILLLPRQPRRFSENVLRSGKPTAENHRGHPRLDPPPYGRSFSQVTASLFHRSIGLFAFQMNADPVFGDQFIGLGASSIVKAM